MRINDKQKARAVKWYTTKKTMTVEEIAAHFGVCKATIYRWAKEAGLSRPVGKHSPAYISKRSQGRWYL